MVNKLTTLLFLLGACSSPTAPKPAETPAQECEARGGTWTWVRDETYADPDNVVRVHHIYACVVTP
jgi:hypothetical protein